MRKNAGRTGWMIVSGICTVRGFLTDPSLSMV